MRPIDFLAGLTLACGLAGVLGAQSPAPPSSPDQRYRLGELAEEGLAVAAAHYRVSSRVLTPAQGYPASVIEGGANAGDRKLVGASSWVSGFYPGVLWYLYEATGDTALRRSAESWTEGLAAVPSLRTTHDLGFMIGSSYGNGYRLTGRPDYRRALLTAAASLASRFDPEVGCTKSWDWAPNRWAFPVIVDNMMNLELLTVAARLAPAGVPYRRQAISHANVTMGNHFRDDYTSYHVVDYDPRTGAVLDRETYQGYADGSMWARGQAWAIYGYVMMAREVAEAPGVADGRYLGFAERLLVPYLEGLPADGVPYWDFDDPDIPNAPRDASAAAIVASALLELHVLSGETDDRYLHLAEDMLAALSSPAYRAAPGTNADFVLRHATGHKPAGREIDVPLVYADYYYVEALLRYRALAAGFRDDIGTVTLPEDTTEVTAVTDPRALLGVSAGMTYEASVRNLNDRLTVRVADDRLTVVPAADYFGRSTVELRLAAADTAAAFRFVVEVTPVNDAPGAFALVAPADGQRLASNNLLFRWATPADAEDDALTYELALSSARWDTLVTGITEPRLRFAGAGILAPGTTYTWRVTASDGTDATASARAFTFVSEGTSDARAAEARAVEAYYDPAADALRVTFAAALGGEALVTVYDEAGRRCREVAAAAGAAQVVVSLDSLPAGVYLYRVRLPGGEVAAGKVIKSGGR